VTELERPTCRNACEVDIGGNRFGMNVTNGDGVLVPMSIDGVPLLAFVLQDGHLLLNLALFDEFNQLVLHIKNNQLLFSVSPWDIQLVGRRLIIREAAKKILIDIVFNVPSAIKIHRARFMRNGVEVDVWPDRVVLVNNNASIVGNVMINCPTGFAIGPHDPLASAVVAVSQVPRYARNRAASREWIRGAFGDERPA